MTTNTLKMAQIIDIWPYYEPLTISLTNELRDILIDGNQGQILEFVTKYTDHEVSFGEVEVLIDKQSKHSLRRCRPGTDWDSLLELDTNSTLIAVGYWTNSNYGGVVAISLPQRLMFSFENDWVYELIWTNNQTELESQYWCKLDDYGHYY